MASWAELLAVAHAAPPAAAFVLGSGLGPVLDRVTPAVTVAFGDIPGLVSPSVAGHGGKAVLGDWSGRRVLIFQGRMHFYEGHSWDTVAAPILRIADTGARTLLLTNAAGGINPALGPGSLMALTDHLAWNRPGAWRDTALGRSRVSPYSADLLQRLREAATEAGVELHQGVYAAVTGPCYETPAEIRALRSVGADAVGMSTAYEIDTGHGLGLACAAVSCVTNAAAGISATPLNHEEVLATAAAQSRRLADLLEAFVCRLSVP